MMTADARLYAYFRAISSICSGIDRARPAGGVKVGVGSILLIPSVAERRQRCGCLSTDMWLQPRVLPSTVTVAIAHIGSGRKRSGETELCGTSFSRSSSYRMGRYPYRTALPSACRPNRVCERLVPRRWRSFGAAEWGADLFEFAMSDACLDSIGHKRPEFFRSYRA